MKYSQEIKDAVIKWTDALRSGEYKQTTHELQSRYNFCCLGVACMEFIPIEKHKLDTQCPFPKLLGLTLKDQPDISPTIEYIASEVNTVTEHSLTELNDQKRLNFDEIADCLEAVFIHEVL